MNMFFAQDRDAVFNAICGRITARHADMLSEFGVEACINAADEIAVTVASNPVEEIGTSDVSCWVNQIRSTLTPTI